MMKTLLLLSILLPQVLLAQPYIQDISDDVKVEYHQDGMVKIYSTDKDKRIHHFNLKLQNLSSNNQILEFGKPSSVTKTSNSIKYHWPNNLNDEWTFKDYGIRRTLTINQASKIKGNNNLEINSFYDTDLDGISAGMGPFTWSYMKWNDNDPDTIDNLKVDELNYYSTDSNCKQLIVNKGFNHQMGRLVYKFKNQELIYPITLTQDFKINENGSQKSKNINKVVIDKNSMAVSYSNKNFVEIYKNKNNKWRLVQKLYPTIPKGEEYSGRFGISLALWNDTLAIGATDEYNYSQNPNTICIGCRYGAVYIFNKIDAKWEMQTRLHTSIKNDSTSFGEALDIFKDTLVIGDSDIPHYSSKNESSQYEYNLLYGAVYVFKRDSNQWNQTEVILPKENETSFGKSVAIDNNTIIVGGSYVGKNDYYQPDRKKAHLDNSKTKDYGQFYIFEQTEEQWQQVAQFKSESLNKSINKYKDWSFAQSIDIDNETIIVGQPLSYDVGIRGHNRRYIQSIPNLDKSGEVYVFKKRGKKWRKQAVLKASNPLQFDHFGSSVKIKGDTILVGAYGDSNDTPGINTKNDNCQLPSSGAVYVYDKKWNGWKQTDYIKSSNPKEMASFGSQLDFDGKTLVTNSDEVNVFSRKDGSWKQNKVDEE